MNSVSLWQRSCPRPHDITKTHSPYIRDGFSGAYIGKVCGLASDVCAAHNARCGGRFAYAKDKQPKIENQTAELLHSHDSLFVSHRTSRVCDEYLIYIHTFRYKSIYEQQAEGMQESMFFIGQQKHCYSQQPRTA